MDTQAILDAVAEEWRDIPGMEGKRQVSSHGRVRSLDPRWNGRLLVARDVGRGYLYVNIGNGMAVHRLVAMAFHGLPESGQCVNHRDGNKKNNRPENLEWTTNTENIRHAIRTGLLKLNGADGPRAKLSKEQADLIRASNRPTMDLAREYGVSRLAIWRIRRGISHRST